MATINYENIWRVLKKYNFEIDTTLFIDLTCVICKNIIKDCRQSLCGCRYCCECIKKYLGGKEKMCPNLAKDCQVNLIRFTRDIQIDHVANMKVSRLIVTCPEYACQYRDELRNIEDHINSHTINCPYLEVGCDKAGLTSSNITAHLSIDDYSHTTLLMNSLQQLKNELVSINGDSKKTSAIIDTLQYEMVNMRNKNIDQAELVDKLSKEVAEYKNLNSKLNGQIACVSNELKMFKKTSKEKEKLVTQLSQQVESKDIAMKKEVGELRTQLEDLKKLVEDAKQMTQVKIPPANPQVRPQIPKKPTPAPSDLDKFPFKWEITNFTEKRKYAVEETDKFILSEPFYTHEGGYKLCLVAWLGGCASSQFRQLSIGFHVMSGKNDSQLKWPMMSTVKIALINQKSNGIFMFGNFDYLSTPYKDKHCFHRPTGEMNPTVPSKDFINFMELTSNQKLFRNDSIVLACTLDEHA